MAGARRPCILTDRSAVAAVEFALIVPFIILLIFGGVMVFSLFRSKLALERGADLVSVVLSNETQVTQAKLNQLSTTFGWAVGTSLTNRQIRISSVRSVLAIGYQVVWTYGNPPQGSLAQSAIPIADLPIIAPGDTAIVVETRATANPPVWLSTLLPSGTKDFASIAVTSPRNGPISKTD